VPSKVATLPSVSGYGFPVPYVGGSYNAQSFEISNPQNWADSPSIFERAIGARSNGFMWFNNFYDAEPSPLFSPNRITGAGKFPMLTFIPETASGVYDLAGIVAGTYDTMIQNWAKYMNGTGIVRFAHEMNISAIWGASYGASNFIALWQHVYTVWRAYETAHSLGHALWFWCANFGTAFDAYYPGDAYVDIIGADGYSEWGASWPAPAAVYTPASFGLADLEALSSTKPIIIGEIGCGGAHLDRATWFTNLFTVLEAHPRVKGFNYWWHNNETIWDHYMFSAGQNTRDDDPAAALTFQAGLAAWAAGVS
jgi:mannan endo-1,4-beta-mannosidase